jgi:hypothetical protein
MTILCDEGTYSKLENQSVQTAVLWSGDNDPVKDDRSYGKYG